MAKIGTLTANLSLESAAFIRDLNKAAAATARSTAAMQRSVARVQRGFASAAAAMRGAFAGVISVATIRSLQNLAETAVKTADEIGAAAGRMGIDTEVLQRLRFAAQQADVEIGSLDAALAMFQKNLAKGTISAEGRDIAEAFQSYIDKIRDAPTQLEKARIAHEAFGKQASVALQLAAESGEEFRKQYQNAHVVGRDAIETADGLDKAWRRVQNAVSTGFQTGFLDTFKGKTGDADQALKNLNETLRLFGTILGKVVQGGGVVARWVAWMGTAREAIIEWREEVRRAQALRAGETFVPSPEAIELFNKKRMEALSRDAGWSGIPSQIQPATDGVTALGEAMDKTNTAATNLSSGMAAAGQVATGMGAMHQMTASQVTQGWLGVAETVAGAFGTLFQDNKAVAIAMAVINTAQAITQALAHFPPPLSFAMAAAQAAAGAAQIAVIARTRPGSSASAPSVRGKGGGGGSKAVAGAGDSSGGLRQSVILNITGESFGPEHFKKLVAGLNGVIADGAVLRVS